MTSFHYLLSFSDHNMIICSKLLVFNILMTRPLACLSIALWLSSIQATSRSNSSFIQGLRGLH
ncbi:hypothetical protein BDZ91DRAFT_738151 [Kalaharituber pfeilii]|nr:hypothetical protein BDZ91DRAFT_738151 [Kalaharituber pfeilii]